MKTLAERLNMKEGEFESGMAQVVLNKKGMSIPDLCDAVDTHLADICIYDSDEVFAISSILYDFNARNAQFTGEMTFWFDES